MTTCAALADRGQSGCPTSRARAPRSMSSPAAQGKRECRCACPAASSSAWHRRAIVTRPPLLLADGPPAISIRTCARNHCSCCALLRDRHEPDHRHPRAGPDRQHAAPAHPHRARHAGDEPEATEAPAENEPENKPYAMPYAASVAASGLLLETPPQPAISRPTEWQRVFARELPPEIAEETRRCRRTRC